VWKRMRREIDWIGAGIASTSLAMLFYGVRLCVGSPLDHA
jgi:hypothetical protein